MRTAAARQIVTTVFLVTLSAPYLLRAQTPAPDSMQQHREKAEQDLKSHDLAGAEHEYREMLSIDPQSSSAWTGLGILLYGSGKAQSAYESLQKALSIDAAAPRAELFLALSEADLRQCDEATPVLTKHFSSEPQGNLQRLTGLALLGCAAQASDPLPAIETAARLKQLYPADPDVLYESAELYTRMWNETAGELISKHPESYRVHELAGEVYEAQNNYDQAIREYSLAIEQNPRLPQMHYRIGQLYLKQAAPDADDKAMSEFQKEKFIDPQSAVADLAMAGIDMHAQKLDEAQPLYQEAASLDPSLIEAKVGLAKILLAQHQTDQAIQQLQAITAANPDSAEAHYVLMTAYRQQKKMPEAAAEMAIFNRLQTERGEKFQNKLNALMNAKPTSSREDPK
jgi:tetratricopeptide (TPR) repeat protein